MAVNRDDPHRPLASPGDVDDEVRGWLEAAYRDA
jgi:hypothetical protein